MSASRAVLTLGLGNPIYMKMAATLARSFRLWHSRSNVRFFIVTDQEERIPADLNGFVEVVPVEPGQFGEGFIPKLYLDELLPAEQTLFVDADCLITGSLKPVFERFSSRSVSTVGRMISEGDWWGDVAERCEKVGVEEVPLLVGCVYYLRDNSVTREVFETARALKDRYDELGFVRLRGSPADGPLISLAMALHDQEPIPDDGKIKADAMSYPSGIDVDVFEGHSRFWDCTDQEHLTGTLREARPVICHFNDAHATRDPYTHEVARLRKVQADGWSLWAAGLYAKIRHTIPQRVVRSSKDALRPAYRALFGTRSQGKNARFSVE